MEAADVIIWLLFGIRNIFRDRHLFDQFYRENQNFIPAESSEKKYRFWSCIYQSGETIQLCQKGPQNPNKSIKPHRTRIASTYRKYNRP